ncbi:GyrI-like domain-containing protein [Vagococcus salmoninarum]|uniref:GyrI-like domain-containing protein n=1 Tax=Vagococcus salmoninarum TaxID=2739 RepID=UPI00187E3017|nr:GyrI-like domain-containing protein [Vagococcus salmoninarum]MBE9389319.1 GyrI-like domain-containing protein [Vagococcus salmoninarum]
MTTNIERLIRATIIHMRQIGPYGQKNQQLMTDFKNILRSQQLMTTNSILLGIPLDDPQLTLPVNCRYDVGLIVPATFDLSPLPEIIQKRTLASGNYASFQVPHTPEGLMAIWADFPTKLKNEGLILDLSRPIIERYASQLIFQHQCELLVPIH